MNTNSPEVEDLYFKEYKEHLPPRAVLHSPFISDEDTVPLLRDMLCHVPVKDVKLIVSELPELCKVQDKLNEMTTPNWRQANLNFARAFYKEADELSEHIPWKWWKHTSAKPNYGQAFMEVVDMFHFWLAIHILAPFNIQPEAVAGRADKPINTIIDFTVMQGASLSVGFPMLSGADPACQQTIIGCLHSLLVLTRRFGYTQKDLVNWYYGKCALNLFRQWNGYKEGTYKKVWVDDDRSPHAPRLEDNDVLEHIINEAKGKITLQYALAQLASSYTNMTGITASVYEI